MGKTINEAVSEAISLAERVDISYTIKELREMISGSKKMITNSRIESAKNLENLIKDSMAPVMDAIIKDMSDRWFEKSIPYDISAVSALTSNIKHNCQEAENIVASMENINSIISKESADRGVIIESRIITFLNSLEDKILEARDDLSLKLQAESDLEHLENVLEALEVIRDFETTEEDKILEELLLRRI